MRTVLIALLVVSSLPLAAQESRLKTPGNGPGGVPETAFLAHRLSTDHAEGITSLDAIREAQQPTERKWPFPCEGPVVEQENGPATPK